jgi:hypothetical protein
MNRTIPHTTCAVLAVLAALLFPTSAEAQHRAIPLASAAGWIPEAPQPVAAVSPASSVPLGRVLVGSAVGTAAGALVGAGSGVLLYLATDPPDGAMFGPLGEALAFGTAGAVVGSWVGTRRASGGAGDPWLTALGSVAGAAAGIGAGYLVGEPLGSIPLGIAVGLPIAVAFPAIVEVMTSR